MTYAAVRASSPGAGSGPGSGSHRMAKLTTMMGTTGSTSTRNAGALRRWLGDRMHAGLAHRLRAWRALSAARLCSRGHGPTGFWPWRARACAQSPLSTATGVASCQVVVKASAFEDAHAPCLVIGCPERVRGDAHLASSFAETGPTWYTLRNPLVETPWSGLRCA